MDTSQFSSYAPEARKAFIAAVSAQAARIGITAKGNTPAEVQGDVLLVGGRAFPKAVASARESLAKRVTAFGFDPTMEAVAYTWFNRFVAIRYMELAGYLGHGYRVLSHPEGQGRPEILERAAEVDLPGLDSEEVVELKLDGTLTLSLAKLDAVVVGLGLQRSGSRLGGRSEGRTPRSGSQLGGLGGLGRRRPLAAPESGRLHRRQHGGPCGRGGLGGSRPGGWAGG